MEKNFVKILSSFIIAILLSFSLALFASCQKNTATSQSEKNKNTTYYVDSQNGNDNNNGLSPETAWRSLAKAGEHMYQAGEKLLLKRGSVFYGSLKIQANGTASRPVIVDAYPDDTTRPLPLINARGHLAGVQITNSNYLKINHLEIVSNAGNPVVPEAKNQRYGVLAEASAGFHSSHIVLNALYVHQIFASAQVPAGGQNPTSNMGMGICFSSTTDGTFSDITIKNCRIAFTGHTGIKIKTDAQDTTLFTHHVNILNNRLNDIGGPGIQPGKCVDVLVSGNLVDHSGSMVDPRMHGRGSGIWPWRCTNVLIEHNTFMYAHGKMDSHGAHIDFGCRNVVIQYNMSISNGGGFVEILGNDHNCCYRYNISINDGWRVKGVDGAMQNGEILFISNYTGHNMPKKGPFNNYIYNNTIYVKKGIVSGFSLAPTTSGLLVANNIFYILGKTQTTIRNGENIPGAKMKNVLFINNLYRFRGTLPASLPVHDSLPLYGDPGFAFPGGLKATDYIPANAALIKNKGIPIEKLPGDSIGLTIGLTVKKDILGNPITGKPDMGAVEMK